MRFATAAAIVLGCACGRIGFDAHDGGGGDGAEIDVGPTIDATISMNVVFITHDELTTDFGGLAAADAICASRAAAAHLPGPFVAWLSTSTADAVDRLIIPNSSTQPRGWVRTDGKPVVDTVADLLAGRLLYPVRLDENGIDRLADDHNVITGTLTTGRVSATDTCADWTTTSGAVSFLQGDHARTIDDWTAFAVSSCATTVGHLLCFGVDGVYPFDLTPANGPAAFVSSASFSLVTGQQGLDNECAGEAGTNGLSGTFLSFASTLAAAATSRFAMPSQPWVRRDGIPLAATAADVLGFTLDTPLDVDITGAYINGQAWTGAIAPSSTATTSAYDCTDWSSNLPGDTGYIGKINSSTSGFGAGTNPCDQSNHVYCLQQ